MNKEEILKRSRQENMNGDEREQKVRTDQDAFSVWGFVIMCSVIMVIKFIQDKAAEDILSILWCGSATAFLYRAIHTKDKLSIFCTVIGYLLALFFFYQFCVEMF